MKMKNSLIAIAGGAASIAMVAPAIAGDVTVYGRAQVEIASVSHNDDSGSCPDPAVSGESSQTADVCDGIGLVDNSMGRVGFKASEDLGNGWKGMAKYELKADTADNTVGNAGSNASFSARESLVGLKGSGVQIELGRLKSAYKYAGGVKYDAFVATTLEARGNGGMTGGALGHSSFLSRHVGVQGGSGPIKFRFSYGAGDGDGSMSGSVQYEQGPVHAFVALVDAGDSQDVGGDEEYSATKIGGAYKMGATKFMLQYEMTDNGATEPTYTWFGVNHKMGKNTFVLQIGMQDADAATSDPDTDLMTIGVIHKFTKMTRLFAGFRSSENDAETQEDVVSVGLRKDF